jgi:hypothetical protein
MHPATSKADIENLIRSMATHLKPNDTFTIFVNDHGDPPSSENSPITSSIVLYSPTNGFRPSPPKLTHAELAEILSKYIPPSVHIKLTGIHCYSGGLHDIAFKLPNACASSSTDFRSITDTTGSINLYGKGFWEELGNRRFDINHDGKTSLYEAHLAGFALDSADDGRGEISSMAYVDSVLKEGAYDEKYSWGLWRLFTKVFSSPKKEKIHLVCEYDPHLVDLNKIESVANALNQISIQPLTQASQPGSLPPQLQTVYQWADRDWKENKSKYLASLRGLQADYLNLKREWNGLGPIDQRQKRGEYTKKFDELEARAKARLAGFFATYRLMENMDRVGRFLRRATAPQKKTFARLLQCEWEPL